MKNYTYAPHPSIAGTACILASIGAALISYPDQDTATAMASASAMPVAIGYLGSLFFDLQKGGLRNLLRTDLLALVGLYALTLAEFLFSQEDVYEVMTTPTETSLSIQIVLAGIAAMAVGRHLVKPQRIKAKWATLNDLSNDALFVLIMVCTILGTLFMLLAVDFKIFGEDSMIYHMQGARFTQPWSRGRLGGFNTLINEFALLLYAVPPLTGVVINRWKVFPKPKFVVVLIACTLVMFHGIAGGTRNVFVAYLATFMMGYLLTLKKNKILNTLLPIVVAVWLTGFISYHMLEFRTIGMRNYIANEVYKTESGRDSLAVDYNLASIGALAINMPSNHDFVGSEIIVWSLIKPIPRALWKGKPEGLSVSVEEVVGAEGWTVAVTYLGEAYMVAGVPGVIAISAFLGALASWWNRMAIMPQSDYALVVYALGFFAAGLTMRSMLWLTTAILPVIALILFRKYAPVK